VKKLELLEGLVVHNAWVFLNPSQSYRDTLRRAGVCTLVGDMVWGVEGKYLPIEIITPQKELILVGSTLVQLGPEEILAWAEGVGLKKTHPIETFCLGAQHPTLHHVINRGMRMRVVETTGCIIKEERYAGTVFWMGNYDRGATLCSITQFTDPYTYFAFSE
jgi:hypothetical protein